MIVLLFQYHQGTGVKPSFVPAAPQITHFLHVSGARASAERPREHKISHDDPVAKAWQCWCSAAFAGEVGKKRQVSGRGIVGSLQSCAGRFSPFLCQFMDGWAVSMGGHSMILKIFSILNDSVSPWSEWRWDGHRAEREQSKFIWRLSSMAWTENKVLIHNCGAELLAAAQRGYQRYLLTAVSQLVVSPHSAGRDRIWVFTGRFLWFFFFSPPTLC